METEMWMAEMAAEELQKLEAQHPGRFDHLKLELKSFIADSGRYDASPSPYASTQVSSNEHERKRKRKRNDINIGSDWKRRQRSKSSVDMAIERAEACLERIRKVKESFSY